jgi:hypothetical protein
MEEDMAIVKEDSEMVIVNTEWADGSLVHPVSEMLG